MHVIVISTGERGRKKERNKERNKERKKEIKKEIKKERERIFFLRFEFKKRKI